jgi:ParB-like chromosome segregation protein Spo0J
MSTAPDMSHNPVSNVRWVPIEKIHANNYNPNSVALMEMKLLYTSIKHDGYTMPIVTIYNKIKDRYEIVDGFHRYSIMRRYPDIRERNHGLLPVVVIDKDVNDRMASTIRHNRARGRHSIDGMSNLVVQMLNNGWSDDRVRDELGLEPEELTRLKHVTGYAKFFLDGEFSRAIELPQHTERTPTYERDRAAAAHAGNGDRHEAGAGAAGENQAVPPQRPDQRRNREPAGRANPKSRVQRPAGARPK